MAAHGIPFICRECGLKSAAAAISQCPSCETARILQHPELHELNIAHVDCDAFYANIEKRDRPELRHKPVIVGGGRRGVVSAACYISRIHGVRSAMPMFTALKLCPDAVVIAPRMDVYREVGYAIRRMMLDLTPMVEPLSIDEAFLDLSGTSALHGASPAESLVALTHQVEKELGISVSVGLAGNKSMAKIASDMDKPRGFHIIGVKTAAEELAPLPVSIIYGAGKKLVKKLAGLGIYTCGDLANADTKLVALEAGELGPTLQARARGIDHRSVTPNGPAKSISSETTFNNDVSDLEPLLSWLLVLSEKISSRMKDKSIAGRRVVLKLKSHDHKIITRSTTLNDPTQLSDVIFRNGRSMLEREVRADKYWRLIGIGVDQLGSDAAADPIDLADPDQSKRHKLENAIDQLRAKHGTTKIVKGRRLKIDQLKTAPKKRDH